MRINISFRPNRLEPRLKQRPYSILHTSSLQQNRAGIPGRQGRGGMRAILTALPLISPIMVSPTSISLLLEVVLVTPSPMPMAIQGTTSYP